MQITTDISFTRFNAWSGGKDTQEKIIEAGKADQFESIMEDLYPDGLTDTQLNDLLWFDSESVFEWLGMKKEEVEA